jgi:hypothetical protein
LLAWLALLGLLDAWVSEALLVVPLAVVLSLPLAVLEEAVLAHVEQLQFAPWFDDVDE